MAFPLIAMHWTHHIAQHTVSSSGPWQCKATKDVRFLTSKNVLKNNGENSERSKQKTLMTETCNLLDNLCDFSFFSI